MSASAKVARGVGKKVLAVLSNRKGFDWWFDDLDSSLKKEIEEEVGAAAMRAVNG